MAVANCVATTRGDGLGCSLRCGKGLQCGDVDDAAGLGAAAAPLAGLDAGPQGVSDRGHTAASQLAPDRRPARWFFVTGPGCICAD